MGRVGGGTEGKTNTERGRFSTRDTVIAWDWPNSGSIYVSCLLGLSPTASVPYPGLAPTPNSWPPPPL